MQIFDVVDVPIWGILVALIFVLFTWYAVSPFFYFKNLDIDGPTPLPLFGNFLPMAKKGFQKFDDEIYKEYKKKKGKRVCGVYMGRVPTLYILDIDLLKSIYVKDFNYFPNRMIFDLGTENVFDLAMTNIRDDHWKHVRSHLTPTFSGSKLRKMTTLIQESCRKLTNNVKTKFNDDSVLTLNELFGGYSIDVIASTMFGLDLDSHNDPDNIFVKSARKVVGMDGGGIGFLLLFTLSKLVKLVGKVGLSVFNMDFLDVLSNTVLKVLDERGIDGEKYVDFLQLMLQAKVGPDAELDRQTGRFKWSSQGLTEKEIISQSVTFLIVGYATTASTMAFLSHALAINPEIQDRVIQEIDDTIGDEMAEYDDIKKLTYLDQVVSETLRMYPVGYRTERECSDDVEIDGIQFKKGLDIIIPIYSFHHDPDYFPDPETFDPERFNLENKNNIHPFAYQPFGLGPRNCVGMRLAKLKLKMGIVTILQKYKFVPCDETERPPLKMNKTALLEPEKPLKLKVLER